MSEKKLIEKLELRLSEYFDITKEVWTECHTGRIDMVLECKESHKPLGLEVKRINKKRGNDMGLLIMQAHEYSKKNFEVNQSFIKIPVFVFPALSYDYMICPEEMKIIDGVEYFRDRHDKNKTHHTIQGFIGVWNVGELRVFEKRDKFKYIRFVFNNQEIWTNEKRWNSNEIKGLHYENYKKLKSRIE